MKKLNFPSLSPTLASKAWTTPKTAGKEMDIDLCEAFTEILDEELSKPNLGCATTGQLLDEIKARVDVNYSTVFHEAYQPPHTKDAH